MILNLSAKVFSHCFLKRWRATNDNAFNIVCRLWLHCKQSQGMYKPHSVLLILRSQALFGQVLSSFHQRSVRLSVCNASHSKKIQEGIADGQDLKLGLFAGLWSFHFLTLKQSHRLTLPILPVSYTAYHFLLSVSHSLLPV